MRAMQESIAFIGRKIKLKTPDEIKKGLECCYSPVEPMLRCEECPYQGSIVCKMKLHAHALAYIQQLEAERDAAVADIRLAFTSHVGACQTCKHGENQVDCIEPIRCPDCENEKCKCQSCDGDFRNWEWRGVQKEAGNEKT